MNALFVALIAGAFGGLGALATWLVGRRQSVDTRQESQRLHSGSVAASDAAVIWQAAEKLRADMADTIKSQRDEVVVLRAELLAREKRCDEQIAGARADFERQMQELRDERERQIRQLREQIEAHDRRTDERRA